MRFMQSSASYLYGVVNPDHSRVQYGAIECKVIQYALSNPGDDKRVCDRKLACGDSKYQTLEGTLSHHERVMPARDPPLPFGCRAFVRIIAFIRPTLELHCSNEERGQRITRAIGAQVEAIPRCELRPRHHHAAVVVASEPALEAPFDFEQRFFDTAVLLPCPVSIHPDAQNVVQGELNTVRCRAIHNTQVEERLPRRSGFAPEIAGKVTTARIGVPAESH